MTLILPQKNRLIPANPALPFFTYGIFKPGELAHWLLAPHVSKSEPHSIAGELWIYDGLPFLDPQSNSSTSVAGQLLHFSPSTENTAYAQISAHGLQNHYKWSVIQVGTTQANCLVNKLPLGVGRPYMDSEWKGKNDPLFTAAIEVVGDLILKNQMFKKDLKPLFTLEAAYLLLWSSIERYASWRYYLGRKQASYKVRQLADEPVFKTALSNTVRGIRVVREAAEPRNKCTLSATDPNKSLKYYYQIRSNLVHQGKSDNDDHDRLLKSASELLSIFREVLKAAFTLPA